MSVIRVNKTKDFTVMSNYHFRDKRLSLKAKGLLSQMLSLPNEWDYTIAGLVSINKENESAIKSALKELATYGYLVITKLLPNETQSGRIEYVYDIYEHPQDREIQEQEKQGVENLGVEIQAVENQPQYNTKELNTDNKILNYKERRESAKRFTPPTVEEVSSYCEERKNRVDPERFVDFYTSVGWKVGNKPMKDWKAAVRTWEKRDFGDGRQKQTESKFCKSESTLEYPF